MVTALYAAVTALNEVVTTANAVAATLYAIVGTLFYGNRIIRVLLMTVMISDGDDDD